MAPPVLQTAPACLKCGQSKQRYGRTDIRWRCRSCESMSGKAYYSSHKKKSSAKRKRWYAANRERSLKLNQEWRKRNPARWYELWRNNQLKRDFGITLDQYKESLAKQNGVCAICGGPPSAGKAFAVDHDHLTDRLRGLLCQSCNNGLGRFKDNPELLDRASSYLRRFKSAP